MKKFKVLSVDAWCDGVEGEGTENESVNWSWNNWFNVGEYDESEHGELTDESALKFFYDNYLNRKYPITAFEIDDDQYNLVIVDVKDRRPLFAIEYGSQY